MRALTVAWTEDGGQVLGLAPSAAAAAVLGEQTGIGTDTLAKLTWSLRNGDLPDWATGVGPATLIIIDEAGMADTLSLDTAVQFAISRGAIVRLIGDDQQLAAIGAGGILRDIKNIHGALHLTELHRFTDPAEAQASLALREGDPSALGFYLDHGRVHVGDLAKITEDAFAAWISDRAVGLDAIMLAPTRELVAELNRRARDHRLDGAPAGQEVRLGDGNRASVGDMIITRTNDRRLRLSATDWVKNGDRWTITHINRSGGLTVRHSRNQLKCQLPADYVTTSTGLGYATTIHGAQGVSADTMHGLACLSDSGQRT
jgi:ATP-dependent exoDNAse (exonuclease V) alpha subunit